MKKLKALVLATVIFSGAGSFAAESLSCFLNNQYQGTEVEAEVPASSKSTRHIFVKELYGFSDVEQSDSGKVVDASLAINGKSYACTLSSDKIFARCGNWLIQDEVFGGWNVYNGVPNYPYMFKSILDSFDLNKAYVLADAYIFNHHYRYFDSTHRTPKSPPASRCISTQRLRMDASRRFSDIPTMDYNQGRFVCIESVFCSKSESVTTLSMSFYLIDAKYVDTLNSVFADDSANRNSNSYRQLLAKVAPLLSQDDVKVGTFTIRLSQKYKPYKPLM